MAYTEGFTPRPKVGFGLALPTAAESVAEYVDIDLSRDAHLDPADDRWSQWRRDTAAALSEALPDGMDVMAITERSAADGSLQEQVTSTTWELSGWELAAAQVTGRGPEPEPLEHALRHVLAADEVLVERERKGQRRTDDVRPLIRDLSLREGDHGTTVVADLVTIGRALRPSELAELIRPGADGLAVRVLRTHQWIDHDGERRDVIPLERPITRTNDDERQRHDAGGVEERCGTARPGAGGQTQ